MTTKVNENKVKLMKELAQNQKSLFQLPKEGDVVEGTVLGKEGGVLYIDLGSVGTGVVYGVEFFKAQDIIKNLSPGDKVTGKLTELENEDGHREISIKEAGEEKNWKLLEEKMHNKEPIDVEVTEANKGGLMVKAGDLTGFLPVSHLTPEHYPRVEGGDKTKILKELNELVGKTLQVHVLDMDQKEERLIFSEREAESEEIEKALAKYNVGDVVEGEITGIVDFGVFIKFDPLIEGLIHVSELDWFLVQDPHDIVEVGDKVKAKIVDIDDDGKVSLSLKQLKENPWEDIEKKIKKGDKIKGRVTKIKPYGALVKIIEGPSEAKNIQDGVQALLHVSEFSSSEGKSGEEKMAEQLEEGDEYEFEVKEIVPEEYKIALKLPS